MQLINTRMGFAYTVVCIYLQQICTKLCKACFECIIDSRSLYCKLFAKSSDFAKVDTQETLSPIAIYLLSAVSVQW